MKRRMTPSRPSCARQSPDGPIPSPSPLRATSQMGPAMGCLPRLCSACALDWAPLPVPVPVLRSARLRCAQVFAFYFTNTYMGLFFYVIFKNFKVLSEKVWSAPLPDSRVLVHATCNMQDATHDMRVCAPHAPRR